MCLSGSSVHGHHPKVTFIFVFAGKDHTVSFLDGIEEVLSLLQFYRRQAAVGERKQLLSDKKTNEQIMLNIPGMGSM